MTERYDVIVLGVGAMGASACRALARRGARVLGLDRHAIPNGRGSSHGRSRVFRLAYYEHHDYVPLLLRSQEGWRRLEEEAGQSLLTTTGGVWMGPAGCDLVAGTVRAAIAHGLAHETYDREGLAARMPGFHLPDGFVGVEEPEAGVLYPEATISALVRLAMRDGATIRAHEMVRSWSADTGGIVVRTDRCNCEADRLVICAGAWAEEAIVDLRVPLRVSRQAQCWVAPRAPDRFALGAVPLWAVEHPTAGLQYGFPILPSYPGLKIAHHAAGETANPDSLDTNVREADLAGMRELLATTLPDADGPLLGVEMCMYTNSPDSHFIIDRHPDHENVALACGFSGHGFKFTPVVGEILADLALTGATSLPAQFLSLQRFSD